MAHFLSLLIECFSNFWLSRIGLVDGLTFLLPDYRRKGERNLLECQFFGQDMCLALGGLFRPSTVVTPLEEGWMAETSRGMEIRLSHLNCDFDIGTRAYSMGACRWVVGICGSRSKMKKTWYLIFSIFKFSLFSRLLSFQQNKQ